jgi:uncharacterized protein YegL
VQFGNTVNILQEFASPKSFVLPALQAGGHRRCVSEALVQVLEMISVRKAHYRSKGISYFMPLIFLIVAGDPNGEPQESIRRVANLIRVEESKFHFILLVLGLESANLNPWGQFAIMKPGKLSELDLGDMLLVHQNRQEYLDYLATLRPDRDQKA